MFRIYCIVVVVISTLFITGCSHQIVVSPDSSSLYKASGSNKNKRYNVGYFISSKDRELEVTTPGGGGESVSYHPYRDIEDGYRTMLSTVFNNVTKLNSANDNGGNIDFVVIPEVVTSSGGAGFFTWPPTNFTVDLTSKIKNKQGAVIVTPRVVGTGTANDMERLKDHAITGKRAMEEALVKMKGALSNINLSSVKKQSTYTPRSKAIKANTSVSERLKRIENLKNNGLINNEEYSAKRSKIIDSL